MLEVAVAGDSDAELRRVTINNHGDSERLIELTSYAELVLGSAAADATHPAFSKLFVQAEWMEQAGILVATRCRRATDDPEMWAAHVAVIEGQDAHSTEFETDRAHFLGRGRTLRNAAAMQDGQALSNTVGSVLDPVLSLRRRVCIASRGRVRVAFWTCVAATRVHARRDASHSRSEWKSVTLSSRRPIRDQRLDLCPTFVLQNGIHGGRPHS